MDIQEFKKDYFNKVSIDEILKSYKLSYYMYCKIIKQFNLKRNERKSFKSLILNNTSVPLEKKIEPNIDFADTNLIYERQYVPRGTEIEVKKTKSLVKNPKIIPIFKEIDDDAFDAIMDKVNDTIKKTTAKNTSKKMNN